MTLLEDFIYMADALNEYYEAFRAKPSANLTISVLETYRKELNDLWSEVKEAYVLCVRSTAQPLKENLGTVKAKYQCVFDTYVAFASEISDFVAKLKVPIDQVTVLPTTKPKDEQPSCSLSLSYNVPPCDTEVFHGSYADWPSFRDMFTAVYINHPRLSMAQKLFHLRTKTKGDAFDIVNKFKATDSNFPLAWNALQEHYENKRILVNNQLHILLSQPSLTIESCKELKRLQSNFNDALIALKSYDIDVDSWSAMITYLCATRLPEKTLSLWEESLKTPTEIPSWKDMNDFLSNRFRILESVSEMKHNCKVNKPNQIKVGDVRSKNIRSFVNNVTISCLVCKQSHSLRQCPEFLKMSVDNRYATVRKHRFCFNCLAYNHQINKCQSKYTCSNCKGKHHSLLHGASAQNTPVFTSERKESSTTTAPVIQSTLESKHKSHHTTNQKQVLLATALVRIYHQGSEFDLRALIDQGSEVSFIAENIQRRLGLPVKSVRAQISGMSSTLTASSSKLCSFVLSSSKNKDFCLPVQAFVLKKLTGNLPSSSVELETMSDFDFPLADPFFNQSSNIDMLIGADLYPHIIMEGLKPNVLNSVMAQNTVFGWVLLGPYEKKPNDQTFSYPTYVNQFHEVSVDQELEKFWKLEEIPQTRMLTYADQYCEDFYNKTTMRDRSGRYIVRLPFKDLFPQEINLGYSRAIAMKQFVRTEKLLGSNAERKNEYNAVLSEYLTLGHMTRIDAEEIVGKNSIQSYYLPHHAVFKPQSMTTKLRVVFNASSPSSNGKSLNDLLYTGPVLQNDITFLILNWRFYKYVFNSDIEKMYRQIFVHPSDTPFQRILFRENLQDNVNDYEIKTVTFGVNCSPFLAIRTLQQLGEDVKKSAPLASRILIKEMYVDDVLSGAHDLITAREAQQQLITVLSSAGFNLRKWTANAPELLTHLPSDHIFNKDFLRFDHDSTVKALGIRWNAISDHFTFAIESNVFLTSVTKRSVLSSISRLYDPAGWLAPIIICAKILMQQIWKDGTGWDENLSKHSLQKWESFRDQCSDIETLTIPRWIQYSPWSTFQVHGFCDASEQAYAATIYVRVQHSPTSFSSHLLWAKTKVAPVNPITLPRLELQGAVLLSKMVRLVRETFNFLQECEFRLWTDSTIVLAWLARPPCTWKTYVANRTSEIHTNVLSSPWTHVSSSQNPSDLATRGITPAELRYNTLWWNGPIWLQSPEQNWPSFEFQPPDDTLMEHKPLKSNTNTVIDDFETILNRFSTWHKAVRVLSYIFRFFARTRKSSIHVYHSRQLVPEEISFIKTRLIILTQKKYFQAEYAALLQEKKLKLKSCLLTLNPFLDKTNIMRSYGRLASSTLTYNERFPILLPYNSLFARLYVAYVHILSIHGEVQLMIRCIRSEFWIPKLKNLVKKTIRMCKPCILFKKRMCSQIMGSLPRERTTLSLPFTNTGIDFAGPFQIKNYYGRKCRLEKGYVCLFVCFATKAIHLEAVSDLSTRAFLAAFSRFVSRRGIPGRIFSDNGTNFVGASKTLMKDFQLSLTQYPRDNCQDFSQIQWSFIPPGAPHIGGLWEAGVKSFKTHFKKIAGSSKFTFEEFSTLLARIESCLNSRPLTRMSDNHSDLLPLTPGHFLRGGPLLQLPESSHSDQNLSLVNRWNNLKILHHKFSMRWKEEYLKELHKRYKWKHPQRDIQVDDLVVVRNEQLPPNDWRLGRVLKVHPGPDNRVRVVDIRTQGGIITRPIVKLCVLPME